MHYAPGSRAWTDCVRPSRALTRGDGFGVKEKKGQARADCVRPSWAPTREDEFGVKEKKRPGTGGLCPTITSSFLKNYFHHTKGSLVCLGHSAPAPTSPPAHHPLDVCYYSLLDEPQLS